MQSRLLFILALLIGLFSYSIFFLGVLGLINQFYIGFLLLIIFFILIISFIKNIESLKSIYIQARKNLILFLLLLSFALTNLIGVFGPELGFDALWYHLTIPKIFILNQRIEFIPGGLFYYSTMPKLIDLLYVPALMFSNEITAKLIHFLFGILTAIITYKISNLFVNKKLSYLAAIIFYSNLVVGWMSTTAYIDLGRAFFASLGIHLFILFLKLKEKKYLYFSMIIVGLEIGTKLLGFSTLISIFAAFLLFGLYKRIEKKHLIAFVLPILVVSPWFIFSFITTNNIFYPFFTSIYPTGISFESFNPMTIFENSFNLFLFSPDPISPVYFVSLPFIFVLWKKMPREMRILLFIFFVNLLIWNFIPAKNSRFILPYLPLLSAFVVWILKTVDNKTEKIMLIFIYLTLFINIIYRTLANSKYINYLIGNESKQEFLVSNLNFEFGDYIDINSKVKEIVGNEKVLIYDIHNLYYVDFNFDHESWKSGKYRYILTREEENFPNYKVIYNDKVTGTYLYEKN